MVMDYNLVPGDLLTILLQPDGLLFFLAGSAILTILCIGTVGIICEKLTDLYYYLKRKNQHHDY
jgi:hypothetical protein